MAAVRLGSSLAGVPSAAAEQRNAADPSSAYAIALWPSPRRSRRRGDRLPRGRVAGARQVANMELPAQPLSATDRLHRLSPLQGALAHRRQLSGGPRGGSRSGLVPQALAEGGGGHGAYEGDREERSEREAQKEEELLRALNLDDQIPESSTEFLAKVSSAAYDMRRRLESTLTRTQFDVVEQNPWGEDDKAVYVLATEDEQLYTMRTRQPRREVEHELDLLFFRGRKASASSSASSRSLVLPGSKPSKASQDMGRVGSGQRGSGGIKTRPKSFRMHVEDIREGILVFEDEAEAAQYCRVLDDDAGPGSECLGIAKFQANELFQVCQKSKALAVVFKKGCMPPSPQFLRHTLKARSQSLEDSEF